MEKYTWTTDETFAGEIKIAHYGAADIRDARVNWTVGEGESSLVASGTLGPLTIKQGGVGFRRPDSRASWTRSKHRAKLKLTVAIEGTSVSNTYDLWVYPPKVDTTHAQEVLVTNRLDATTLKLWTDGGKVLLFPRHDDLTHCVGGAFADRLLVLAHVRESRHRARLEPAPGTQGFLCDPNHPALAEFPTEFHSNWQWWRIVKNARPIILDETPADYRPIIHVIDNFARNHKLGLLFETKVGQGKLLVCASDLPALQDHPEARQLMHSLLRYVGSDRFQPAQSLDVENTGEHPMNKRRISWLKCVIVLVSWPAWSRVQRRRTTRRPPTSTPITPSWTTPSRRPRRRCSARIPVNAAWTFAGGKPDQADETPRPPKPGPDPLGPIR